MGEVDFLYLIYFGDEASVSNQGLVQSALIETNDHFFYRVHATEG
jgi:hypothetical protein